MTSKPATGSTGEVGGLQIALPSPDHSRLRASGRDKAEKAGLEVKGPEQDERQKRSIERAEQAGGEHPPRMSRRGREGHSFRLDLTQGWTNTRKLPPFRKE